MRENLVTVFDAVANAIPDQVALVHADLHHTWRTVIDRSGRLAAALTARGIGPGDRVGIGLWSSPDYLEMLLAVMRIGAVPFNVNYRYRKDELAYILTDSNARALVFDTVNSAVVADAMEAAGVDLVLIRADFPGSPDAAPPDEPVGESLEQLIADHQSTNAPAPETAGQWLLYTGGTTGRPKAVASQHSALWRSLVPSGFAKFPEPVPQDLTELSDYVRRHSDPQRMIVYSAAPLIHGTGIYSSLGALVAGGRVVFSPQRSFDPEVLLDAVRAEGVTDLVIVGDVFARPILRALDLAAEQGRAYELPNLRRVASIGAVFSAEAKDELLRHLDVTITDIVVASEGGPFAMSVSQRGPGQVSSRFMLAPGARLLDAADRDVEPGSGQVGVLAAPAFPDMAYRTPSPSDPTYRLINGELCCAPGDMASLNADGSLIFQGRGSRVINTGGEKVFAEEVETAITAHPAVRDALVVPLPDERYGQIVTAVVSVIDGEQVSAQDLRTFVGERLSAYKKPRRVVFVPEVRRTPVGKADLAWARQTAANSTPE